MKEFFWGIVGTIIALISLIIQFIKEIKANRQEKELKKREELETLLLTLCEQIECYNGVYRVKFINTSLAATAYNLKVSFRIKNRRFNYTYKIPDFGTHEEITSSKSEEDKSSCEIYARINVLDIDSNEIKKNAPSDIIRLFEDGKLELRDLLKDDENYLAIRYNAVNSLTGRTVEFAKREFTYKDIKYGRFGIGNDFVTPLE